LKFSFLAIITTHEHYIVKFEDRAKTLAARVTMDESRDEVYSTSLLAANVSTEVGLVILDVLD